MHDADFTHGRGRRAVRLYAGDTLIGFGDGGRRHLTITATALARAPCDHGARKLDPAKPSGHPSRSRVRESDTPSVPASLDLETTPRVEFGPDHQRHLPCSGTAEAVAGVTLSRTGNRPIGTPRPTAAGQGASTSRARRSRGASFVHRDGDGCRRQFSAVSRRSSSRSTPRRECAGDARSRRTPGRSPTERAYQRRHAHPRWHRSQTAP